VQVGGRWLWFDRLTTNGTYLRVTLETRSG
jgi:hypothetical protein